MSGEADHEQIRRDLAEQDARDRGSAMSASEKLKALVGQRLGSPDTRYDVETALLDALPQIVAVVEAAETMEKVDTIYPGDIVNLRAALAALDEVLS